MSNEEMTICQCVEYLDTLVGDDKNIKDCLDYIERKAKSMDKKLRDYKNIFEEEHPFDGNSFDFLYFKMYSNSTLKRMTKDWLIDYIHVLYINWKNTDNTCERVSRLAKELYEKSNLYKTALEIYVNLAEECDFGYDQMPDEYEKYKNAIENMGYCEGLIYIAINEAEEKLEHDGKTNV